MKNIIKIGTIGLLASCATTNQSTTTDYQSTLASDTFAKHYSSSFVGNFFTEVDGQKTLIGFNKLGQNKVQALVRVFSPNASIDDVARFDKVTNVYRCEGVEDRGRFLGRCEGPNFVHDLTYDHALSWELYQHDLTTK